MRTSQAVRRLGPRIRGNRGFTLTEVLIVAGVSIAVALAAAVAYQGTVRSWRGTAALLELQRDASLGIELVQNRARAANRIDVSAAGDSIDVYYETAGGESLAGRYYVDASGYLRDLNGTALAAGVDSLGFTQNGGTLNIDMILKNDIGTPNRTTDDQAVFISSSVVCRNW